MKPNTCVSPGSLSPAPVPRYTVTDLGILPGFESSRATALNDRGQVVGSLSREGWDFSPLGFLWSEGRMREIGNVLPMSINNKGQIIGGKRSRFTMFSAAISSSHRFQDLLKNTSAMSMARCINDCGQVVGHIQSTRRKIPADIKRSCFVWENGKRRYLDIPDGYKAGDAVGINNHGQIVGELWANGPNEQSAVLNNCHACSWNEDTITIFEEPTGFNQSKAVAINNYGQIVVQAFRSDMKELMEYLSEGEPEWDYTAPAAYDSTAVEKQISLNQQKIDALPKDTFVSRWQYFLWENSGMQPIEGVAKAVNDYGQVVGRWIGWNGALLTSEEIAHAESCKAPYAFLWQNGELLDLNTLLPAKSGWQLTEANGINNKGQIVGNGEIGGKTRAFLLTPIV